MCEPKYRKLTLPCVFVLAFLVFKSDQTMSANLSTYLRSSNCPSNLVELLGHCYEIQKDTTFPHSCSYKDAIPFNSYSILTSLVSILNGNSWLNVRKNNDYGYYEWLEIGDTYGTIFSKSNDNGGECITYTTNMAGVNYHTRSCEQQNTGLCIYKLSTPRKTYCDSYNEICGTTKHCHCQTEAKGYLCEGSCSQTSHLECQTCEYKFAQYPKPTITLNVQYNYVIVTVKNALKLAYINNDNLIFCFTDVYTASETNIRYRFKDGEITKWTTGGDTIIYSLPVRSLGPGRYWCDAFEYPNLEMIRSNTVIAGSKLNYGLNFVVNVTVKLKGSHTLLPYNIHTETQRAIESSIRMTKILSVRPIELSKLYNDRSKVDIIFHISTKTNYANPEDMYAELYEGLVGLHKYSEIVSYGLSNSEVCVSEIEDINGISVEWPTVNIGKLTTPTGLFLQENGLPITRTCSGSFMYGGYWSETSGDIDLKHQYSETTKKLHDLLILNATANDRNQGLQTILQSSNDFIPYDIHLVANIFELIVTSNERYEVTTLTDNLNMVTQIDRSVLAKAQQQMNATDSLLYNFDIALGQSHKTENVTDNVIIIITDNVITQVSNLKVRDVVGLALYKNDGKISVVSLNTSATMEGIPSENLVFATFIPPILLEQILDERGTENLVTAVFMNDALFNGDGSKSSVSLILSMFVTGFGSVALEAPIPIAFHPLVKQKDEKRCGYWNYGIDDLWASFQGRWEFDANAIFDQKFRTCNFSHMTHFALLVGAREDAIIDYLSTIGCALSLVSISAIFITAFTSKSWRESAGTKILLNFCAAIAIQMIVLLILEGIDPERNQSFCVAIGICLHYIVISQFCWMLVISYLQYRKFVQVLVNEPQYIIIKSSVFSWLAPTIPVIAVLSIDVENYHRDNICYPSGLQLYVGLFLPIICIISTNMVMFVLIFRSVLYKKTAAFGKEKKLGMLKIKLGIILFFLMGFSWIFGLVGSFLNVPALLYIFCITTTIQGFVLYLYFVVCNKSTRRMWAKRFKKFTSYKSEEGKTSTTSQSDSQQKKY